MDPVNWLVSTDLVFWKHRNSSLIVGVNLRKGDLNIQKHQCCKFLQFGGNSAVEAVRGEIPIITRKSKLDRWLRVHESRCEGLLQILQSCELSKFTRNRASKAIICKISTQIMARQTHLRKKTTKIGKIKILQESQLSERSQLRRDGSAQVVSGKGSKK